MASVSLNLLLIFIVTSAVSCKRLEKEQLAEALADFDKEEAVTDHQGLPLSKDKAAANHELALAGEQTAEQFKIASAFVRDHKPTKTVPMDRDLTLYALFKQALVGDVNTPQPWRYQRLARKKWDAWSSNKGKSPESAQKEYIAEVEKQKTEFFTQPAQEAADSARAADGEVQSQATAEAFEAASAFARDNEPAKTIPDGRKLILYGLYKQATVGDINIRQPWAVQLEASAKWDAWSSHQGKSTERAQKEYIAELEKQKTEFYAQTAGEADFALPPAEEETVTPPTEEQFWAAMAFINHTEPGKAIPNARKLILYGLFQQATVGDIKFKNSKPSVFDFVQKDMWDAWISHEGKSQETAMQEYIAEVKKQKAEFFKHRLKGR